MSKRIESEEAYEYTGPSVIEIQDHTGKILVSPTINREAETSAPQVGSTTIRFLDTEGNLIGSTDGISPYDW